MLLTLNEKHKKVGDQKGSTAVLLRQIRKPPDVTKAHCISDCGQQKRKFTVPAATLLLSLYNFLDFLLFYDILVLLLNYLVLVRQ